MRRDVFQAIADPTRRKIISMIAHKSLNVNAVAENFHVSRAAVYKHIKILTECGLVVVQQQGRERYCEARLEKLGQVMDWVTQYAKAWTPGSNSLEDYFKGPLIKKKKEINMKKTNEPDDDISSRELVITRIYNAPQSLMFKAWTDPKRMAQWWGPHEFTNPVCELDVRPGGSFLIDMRASDGEVFPMKGTFHEVEEPERLVFTSRAFEDNAGNVGLEAHNTVTFTEHNGKTKLSLRAVVIQSALGVNFAIDGMEQGWNQSFDKLEKEIGEI